MTAQQDEATTYVLEQGEDCVPITPLGGDESVEAFYDWDVWRTDYSSAGTQDLQRPNESIVFLYRGPDDRLSLVLVHGALDSDEDPDDSDGGSVSMDFVDFPADGEWLVQDDRYDGPTNYDQWQTEDEPQRVDWTWAGYRTDGGAYGSLGSSFEVTIEPAFNEAAALYGEYYDGDVTEWFVLSGNRDDPDRTTLAMDEPVTIRTGACESDESGLLGDLDDLLDVDVVPDIVNPDSRGILPVDVGLRGDRTFDDVALESIRTVPGGASPVQIVPAVGGPGEARLFFGVPDLDLSGEDSATFGLRMNTNDGQTLEGETSVDLVPSAGDEEDVEEAAEEAEEEAEEALEEAREEAEEALEEAEEEAEEALEDGDDDDDDDDDDGRGRSGGRGPDGDGPPGRRRGDDDDEDDFFDDVEELFEDDGDDDDDEDDD